MKDDDSNIAKRLHRHSLPTGALSLAVSPQGDTAFVGCLDGVYELDVASGHGQKLYDHDSYVSGVVHFHEDDVIISAGYDGILRWYDRKTRSCFRHLTAHSFWSWDLARAKDAPIIATVTGQYLAGSYEYFPLASPEPCIRVVHAATGELLHSFDHAPPVQSVAVSNDGKLVAAGNLMGDMVVWDLATSNATRWNTPDFTAFGIIKSHCQIGGIYACQFARSNEVIAAGMGPMRDPMAGNGKQRWQRFAIHNGKAEKVAQSNDKQVGEGLMETLAMHPDGDHFVMGGRLRGGSWNVGIFSRQSNELVHSFKTDTRVTHAEFTRDGSRLVLAGADKQQKDATKPFGVVDVYQLELDNASEA